jgi:hypothetical protein
LLASDTSGGDVGGEPSGGTTLIDVGSGTGSCLSTTGDTKIVAAVLSGSTGLSVGI